MEIEYRFHMQDDLILCDNLKDYIPEVERIMRANDMHLMSLYAPRYKQLKEANEKGIALGEIFGGLCDAGYRVLAEAGSPDAG